MPQPIYIPRRQNPWEAMLPQLIGNMLLSKMRHKQEMDLYAKKLEEQKLANEREKLWDLQMEDVKTEGKINIEREKARLRTPYTVGEIKEFKEGDQFVTKKYVGPKQGWVPTGVTAPRYKPPEMNINIDTSDQVTKQEWRDLRSQEAHTRNVLRLTNKLLTNVGDDASLIGFTGKSVRGIDALSKQLMAMSELVRGEAELKGKPVKDSALLNPENYNWKDFEGKAAQSAKIKSMVTRLAYAIARAREPGRLSDQDLQRAIDEIGASSGSPAQMRTVLNEIKRDIQREYALRYQVLHQQAMPEEFFGQEGKTDLGYDAEWIPGQGLRPTR